MVILVNHKSSMQFVSQSEIKTNNVIIYRRWNKNKIEDVNCNQDRIVGIGQLYIISTQIQLPLL